MGTNNDDSIAGVTSVDTNNKDNEARYYCTRNQFIEYALTI